jgi:hypothetical protein
MSSDGAALAEGERTMESLPDMTLRREPVSGP